MSAKAHSNEVICSVGSFPYGLARGELTASQDHSPVGIHRSDTHVRRTRAGRHGHVFLLNGGCVGKLDPLPGDGIDLLCGTSRRSVASGKGEGSGTVDRPSHHHLAHLRGGRDASVGIEKHGLARVQAGQTRHGKARPGHRPGQAAGHRGVRELDDLECRLAAAGSTRSEAGLPDFNIGRAG